MVATIDRPGGRTSTSPQLVRGLGLFSATSLVVANMVGAGIFTTSGLLLGELGNPLVMLALWAAGGVLALAGALCYGALGAALPGAGGEYLYLGRLFHPVLGFLSGWVSFLAGFSAPLAASALACSHYLLSAVPVPAAVELEAWRKLLALLVVSGFTLAHVRGIRAGARVQNALTTMKVLLIVSLLAAGALSGRGEAGHLLASVGAETPGWRTMGLALMWIMFAYSGWNSAGYVGSEIRDPRRVLPRSLLLGTGAVTLLYLGLNVLYIYAVPPAELRGVVAVGSLAAERLFGDAVRTLFAALIGFALLSSVSALVMLGPRVYYAMARDGYFFRAIAAVRPSTRVPVPAIVLQSALAAVLIVSGTFEQILTYLGFCLGIFPILAVLGLFRLPARPGLRVVAVVFAAVSTLMLVLAFQERPVESSIALLTVATGIPCYFLFRMRAEAT